MKRQNAKTPKRQNERRKRGNAETRKRGNGLALIALLCFVTSSCRKEPAGPSEVPAADSAGVPVALPDLPAFPVDSLEPAVRDQVLAAEATARAAAGDASAEAEAVGRLGMLYHVYDLPGLAGPCYQRAAALAPGDIRWHYYLGLVSKSLGELDAAAAACERALDLDSAHVPTIVEWADLELMRNHPNEALAGFRKALSLRPNSAVARCGAGRALLALDEPKQALVELSMALNIEPKYSTARYARGLALRKLDRKEEALAELQLAEKHKDEPTPFDDPLRRALEELATGSIDVLHRGAALLTEGRAAEALPLLEEAVRLNPNLAEARTNLGTAFVQLGDFVRAEEQLRAALAIDPNYVQARYNLGLIAHRKAQAASDRPEQERLYWEAIGHFSVAATIREDHFESLYALGADLNEVGKPADAIEPLLKAERLRPYEPRPPKELADALTRVGRDAEAVAVLRAASERLPHDFSIKDRLAWLLATSPDDSVRDVHEALRLARAVHERTKGAEPMALDTLAAALAAVGQYDEAVTIAGQAMEGARRKGNGKLAGEIEARLALYQANEAFRRSPVVIGR